MPMLEEKIVARHNNAWKCLHTWVRLPKGRILASEVSENTESKIFAARIAVRM